MRTIGWIVRKDLLRFIADRPGAVMTVLLPVVLASLLSVLLAPVGPRTVAILVVDQDGGEQVRELIGAIAANESVSVEEVTEAQALKRVKSGDSSVAVVFPDGTSDALTPVSMLGGEPAPVRLLYDPSRSPEADLVAGTVVQVSMEQMLAALNDPGQRAPFLGALEETIGAGRTQLLRNLLGENDGQVGGAAPEGGTSGMASKSGVDFTVPVELSKESVAGEHNVEGFNIHAHTYGGMLCMFLLFMALEQARNLINERASGTLTRVRLTGASPVLVLLGTGVSTTIIALFVSLAVYATGMLLFDISITGPVGGFALVLLAQAVFAGSFALLIAGLARTERQAVNLGTAVILLVSFAGGAWIPAFLMPEWLETIGPVLPTWWATEGLAAMTWRAGAIGDALESAGALFGLALVTGVVGNLTFRWST